MKKIRPVSSRIKHHHSWRLWSGDQEYLDQERAKGRKFDDIYTEARLWQLQWVVNRIFRLLSWRVPCEESIVHFLGRLVSEKHLNWHPLQRVNGQSQVPSFGWSKHGLPMSTPKSLVAFPLVLTGWCFPTMAPCFSIAAWAPASLRCSRTWREFPGQLAESSAARVVMELFSTRRYLFIFNSITK